MKTFEITRKDRQLMIEAGRQAFQKGESHSTCPYDFTSGEAHWWLYGWWKTYYAQRDSDAEKISTWLLDNVLGISNKNQADAIASIAVSTAGYEHDKPILDNRISGIEFDIPAPSSMK